jgi:hypothetical protein
MKKYIFWQLTMAAGVLEMIFFEHWWYGLGILLSSGFLLISNILIDESYGKYPRS